MIDRLGVIPAAGTANRFGGVIKELLPLHDQVTLLKHTLNAMKVGRADVCLLITNRDKLQTHAKHLEQWQIYYAVQFGGQDIWSAIVESLPLKAKQYLFAMPDTYYPLDVFSYHFDADFTINWFTTDKPERYGILTEQGIINKQPLPPGKYKAWGTLVWSQNVADLWTQNLNKIKTYTQAFNMAINEFGFKLNKMDFYHDLATIEDYRELVNGL